MANIDITIAWIVGAIATIFSTYLVYEFVLEFGTLDPYSHSNSGQIVTDHFDLRLDLDFENKVIRGEQKLKMRTIAMFTREAVLDIKGIDVSEVYFDDTPVTFKIQETKPEIGQALRISTPFRLLSGSEFELTIKYTTSTTASALSWLESNQTEGGKLPYLFTQCETTHCRSIAPFQDTPAIKSTFSVLFLSPADLIVRATGNKTQEFEYDNHRSTKFESNIPVPSYLFAFVVGDLVEQKIGNFTYVITEKEYLADAVRALVDLETSLKVIESYLTPYIWGDYKIVIQPASFPHGGMENPLLSFASPTIIQGDASSVTESVHEIAHTWAGNLVTHNTWTNVWIKEALATFLERKATKIMRGENAYLNFAQRGAESMAQTIKLLGENNSLTSLTPDPSVVKYPDDILNAVQTEKGFQLFAHIEQQIGEVFFQDFIIQFFEHFELQSIDPRDIEDFFIEFIYDKYESTTARNIYAKINFKQWITEPGMPPIELDFKTPEYISAIALAEEYIITDGDSTPSNWRDWSSYSIDLKYLFLDHFLKNTTRLTDNIVSTIDSNNDLYYLTNPDLITVFMQIAIAGDYYETPFRFPSAFVATVGRLENILPIYIHMAEKDEVAAKQIYAANAHFYHPTVREEIKRNIGL
jgi:leukotriene-A4 hydrolase